ncbi:non-homologous end-joining DNA ligase [Saccharothrix sp. 6-C]|uniref:non-homologous end-joining DNA ligase n=1 Tax=Saccharothrix sp. 6-C TaxID=2781735 RepID=UPI002E2B7775|nr:non-homologous end-joining DNA ligase [Saccharothrix sp. 6-C]
MPADRVVRVARRWLLAGRALAPRLIPGDDDYLSVPEVVGVGRAAVVPGDQPIIAPMLATPGDPPTGPGWVVEFKWDGYRGVAYCQGGDVRVLSRNQLDLTDRFPELRVLPEVVGGRTVVLDGEIVALGPDQRPSFELLQRRTGDTVGVRALRAAPIAYYVFDLLVLDGRSVWNLPYAERRAMLTGLRLPGEHAVQVPPCFPDTEPAAILRVAGQYELEGIVSKRATSRYEPGRRSPAWVKTPLRRTAEVVVGGWKPGRGRRSGTVGSLLLGAYDGADLVFVGHVGTGFTDRALADLRQRLAGLQRSSNPFGTSVPREFARDARWVEPVLVGDVEFRNWTTDHRLRHPSWRGLRDDRAPREVHHPGH